MKKIACASVALVALLAGAPACAADTHLPVPGQDWEVRFDAPAFEKQKESNTPDQYMLAGNGGRFNLSFFVEKPSCPLGLDNKALYGCYRQALERNPMVVPGTVRGFGLAKGVSVMYVIHVEAQGQKVTLFNVNVLFAHAGKQGDLHVSMTNPQDGEIERIVRIAESFDIVDTAPAAAPAPAASAAN
jgi:hypothetical protein